MNATLRECVTKDVGDGSYEKPIAMLREELSRHPEDVEAKMMLGVCCQMAGEDDDCLRIYEEVRPQMELRESAGEDSEVVSFWRKYRGLVAALLMVGVIPFCGAAEPVVAKGLGPAVVQPVAGNRGVRSGLFETDMQKAANDPSIEQMAKENPDGVQMFVGTDGDLIWISTGTGVYDFTDEDAILNARKEATVNAKRRIYNYFKENFSTEEKAMEAAKKVKLVNPDGKDGQIPVDKERIKKIVEIIESNPSRILLSIVVVKEQKIPSSQNGGVIRVTVGCSTKEVRREMPAYGGPRFNSPPIKAPKYGGPSYRKYGGPQFGF